MNTFTLSMTSATTITLSPTDGAVKLSVQADPTGGSFTFLGSYKFQNITPTPLTLTDGQGVTIDSPSTNTPLSGITITWVSGTVDLIIAVS